MKTQFSCGDKSLSHRALILAAIADGPCVIRNILPAQDVLSTARCLAALGAQVTFDGTTARVAPICHVPQWVVTLDCGNSGTTARLLAGLVAGLNVRAVFVGDKSLSQRPMRRVTEPLTAIGADFDYPGDCLFRCNGGAIKGGTVHAQVNSAQVKSAVLLAGLFGTAPTVYIEQLATRNHTENMLRAFGADIQCDDNRITVSASEIHAFDITLPNDCSSVAYPLTMALFAHKQARFDNVLLNPTRSGFLNVLIRSGASIRRECIREVAGEAVGDVIVRPSTLSPLHADERDVTFGIDEVPLMAAIALTIAGTHTFCGVGELRFKECDRLQAICDMAAAVGQSCTVQDDCLTIVSDGVLPRNAHFATYGDHRMAMCAALLSLYIGGGSADDAPFAISFPNFLSAMGIRPLRFGLIGGNVSDSKSPLLMRVLARQARICCSYETIDVPDNASDDDISRIISQFDGLNVTMPLKGRVARLLGARYDSVNTVGKRIAPRSTDGYGAVAALQAHGVRLRDASLWIIGAGGAADACVNALTKYGCKMQVFNRTRSKADALARKYNLCDVPKPDGVLSFVPPCEFEDEFVLPSSVKFVLRAAYSGDSNLRRQAAERNITYIDGLEMLYHQGAKSFALWTGTSAQHNFEEFIKELQ